MDLEDALAAAHVGAIDHHAAVEAAGTKERGIEHVGTVGRGHEDDALGAFEAVHLDEELVQGLLALVVAAAEAGAAMTADRVDLIDEDDAGRALLALFEEVADAGGAHTHEHLDEVGTGDREEGHVGFAGDGAGEERLAGARRAHQQDALGNAAAELLELLGLLEELDDLLQLFLRFLDPGHVLERDLALLRREQPRLGLAEGHGLVAARLHLTHEEDPDAEENGVGGERDQDRGEGGGLVVEDIDLDLLGEKVVEGLVVAVGHNGLERVARGALPADLAAVHRDFLDVPGVDLGHEVGELDRRVLLLDVGEVPGGEHQDEERRPEECGFKSSSSMMVP